MAVDDTSISLITLGWLFTGLLLFMLVTCIVAGRGGIPLNPFLGVRVPALTTGPAAWRAGHAAGVLPAAVTFAIALVCSAIGLVVPLAYWGAIAAFAAGVIWVLIRASSAASAVNAAGSSNADADRPAN